MSAPRLIVPGLYELRLSMPLSSVNVFFLLTAEGVTLIDTGYPDRGIGVLAGLSALGRTSADIRHIIVTHHHIDHAGNLATLQTLSNATVWMHPLDAEEVRHGRALRPTIHNAPGWFNWLAAKLAAMIIPQTITPAQVDQHVTDGTMIPFAGGLIAVHIPGHSTGQIALYWPAQQTLFVADAAVHRGRRLHMPPVLEDETANAASLARLATYRFSTLCFGHGPACSGPERNVRFDSMLQRWRGGANEDL